MQAETSEQSVKKTIQKLQRAVVDGLEDVKAQDIQVFDTEHLSALFERVIIASGTSNRQTRALAASVRDAVRQAGFDKPRIEGEENGEWIIVDCGSAVVHIMQPAIRQYYTLEEIWGEKPVRMRVGGKAPAKSAATGVKKTAAKTAAKTGKATSGKAAGGKAATKTTAGKPAAKKAATAATATRKPATAKASTAKASTAKTTVAASKSASTAKTKAPAAKAATIKAATAKKTPAKAASTKATSAKAAEKKTPAARKPAAKTARASKTSG